MPHFFQHMAGGDGFAAIDVEGAEFCFRGGRHDGLDYLGDGVDGAVVVGDFCIILHEKMSSCPASGLRLREVGCVAVRR